MLSFALRFLQVVLSRSFAADPCIRATEYRRTTDYHTRSSTLVFSLRRWRCETGFLLLTLLKKRSAHVRFAPIDYEEVATTIPR